MKISVVLSIGWRVFLFILLVILGAGIYWYYNPLSINLQIIPYGSLRVQYKLFDNKIIIDNFVINKNKIYISPIAIPLTAERIPRICVRNNNEYIIIKNLRPLAIKNNYIEIELKNFDLHKFLKKRALKGVTVTTNASVILLDNKQFGLDVQHLLIKNTPVGDIKTQFNYYKNNLNMRIELQKYNHKLQCTGLVDLGKEKKWNLKLIAQNTANIKKLKIKDIEYTADIKYYISWCHWFNDEKLLLKVTSDNTNIHTVQTKNIILGNINIDASCLNNQINGILQLSKFRHLISCFGTLRSDSFDLNIKPNNPINIKDFIFMNNLVANGVIEYGLHAKRLNGRNNFTGYTNIVNCDIRNVKNNVLIKNIIGNFKLNNNTLFLENLTAELFNFVKGKVCANGKLNIDDFNIKAQIQMPNGELHNVPYAKSGISLDIQIDGSLKKNLNANGEIKLTNASVDITPIISSSMTATDITKNIFGTTSPNQTKLNKITLPINTNIKVTVAPQITINGTDLTSTWKGGGYFKSEAGKPITWNIKLNAICGKYEILKKKIKLYSGEILSTHLLPNYYKISLTAQKKIDSKNYVGIKFTQYNDNTDIVFFSNTMRNKQSILSLFLFNKESTELTISEAYSLGLLIQDIIAGNENIIAKLNKLFKIDTFEIKHNDTGTSEYNSVVLGKKFGKWNFNFEQGKDLDTTKLSMNRRVKKQTKIEFGLSKSEGLEGGISWSKRY